MTATPDISVIIPSHDRWHTLPRALDSVLAQQLQPLEVIVVDDGSSDDTAALMAEHYPSVRLLQQKNQGVSAARNSGIKVSKGRWIALLDSDDVWHPEKLERQREQLIAEPVYRLCHCDEIWIRNGVRVNPKRRHQKTGGWVFEQCLPLCAISPSAALIRRDVFEDIGFFDPELPACEDYDFWLRLTHREPVLYIEEALLNKYGGHEDQLSRAHWGMDRFRIQVLLKLLAQDLLSREQRDAALTTLEQKLGVYMAGANKRGRTEETEQLQQAFVAVDDRRPAP